MPRKKPVEPTRAERVPVNVGFRLVCQPDRSLKENLTEYFIYEDGSTGPLPEGKTYFSYLPQENKDRAVQILADIIVREITEEMEEARQSEAPATADPVPQPTPIDPDLVDKLAQLTDEDRRRLVDAAKRLKKLRAKKT